MSRKIQKALVFAGICVALLVAFKEGNRLLTKRFSPEAQAVFNSSGINIIVDYCQPSVKGRDIFGLETLVPYGEVWRTGANEATEVNIDRDVTINGKTLSAGEYTLFTIPDDQGWTIIFNEELGQWGAFDYDSSQDVLRVEVPAQKEETFTEVFTIDFEEADSLINMRLMWDEILVRVPIKPIG